MLWLIALQILVTSNDPVRATQASQMIMQARSASATTAKQSKPIYEKLRKKQFEAKFNNLVEAVSEFAKEYNAGKGTVWPHKKAEALQKAMKDYENAQKTLMSPNLTLADSR